MFKPLNEMDFHRSTRSTHSYVQMPEGYANSCTGRNKYELAKKNLNNAWVSVPIGSEHVSFLIMRKNTFEEQLFKYEDERYEFDHITQLIRRTIKLMDKFLLSK